MKALIMFRNIYGIGLELRGSPPLSAPLRPRHNEQIEVIIA